MKFKDVEIRIGDKEYQFALLESDVKNALNIIKHFPSGIVEKDKPTLIPQLWWGNLNNPKIIILGKNPSCRDSDYTDNEKECFRDELIKNLSFYNRTPDLNLGRLFNKSSVGVINTWMDEYNLKSFKKLINDVAIYNMFGYYETHINTIDTSLSHIAQNKEIKNSIIDNILDKDSKVYFLWKSVVNPWIEILCDGCENEREELLRNKLKNAKVVSKKGLTPHFNKIEQ